jgi:hypothetical protein
MGAESENHTWAIITQYRDIASFRGQEGAF